MFCVKCGNELPKIANFCPKCGYKVSALPESVKQKDVEQKTTIIITDNSVKEECKRIQPEMHTTENLKPDGGIKKEEKLEYNIEQPELRAPVNDKIESKISDKRANMLEAIADCALSLGKIRRADYMCIMFMCTIINGIITYFFLRPVLMKLMNQGMYNKNMDEVFRSMTSNSGYMIFSVVAGIISFYELFLLIRRCITVKNSKLWIVPVVFANMLPYVSIFVTAYLGFKNVEFDDNETVGVFEDETTIRALVAYVIFAVVIYRYAI